MTNFEDKAASLVEEMQRELHERMLRQLDAEVTRSLSDQPPYEGTVFAGPAPTPEDVRQGLVRMSELMQQMRDTPELRFKQLQWCPRGTMYEVKEVQRDPKTGQAYQLVFIHPDDVPVVRAALIEQIGSEPSILRTMLPLGLEPEGPTTPEERAATLKWLGSMP